MGAWASTGARTGLGLGAASGAAEGMMIAPGLLMVISAPIGALVGGLLGAVVGLSVGVLTGAVLAALAITPVLRPNAPRRECTTTLIAVVIAGVGGLAILYPLLRSFPDRPILLLPILLTPIAGVLIAAAASRRLPPARR